LWKGEKRYDERGKRGEREGVRKKGGEMEWWLDYTLVEAVCHEIYEIG
jgi:hypothetical protein